MGELRHPNVVRVLDPEGEEEGFYYFVMEHVPGGDLHRAVLSGKVDVDRGFAIIESIADVLAIAHESGLVHRDVKPENILLRADGSAALSDFDLVRANDTTGGTKTAAMGSVVYTAPEQVEDASGVDHRADIYGLGMTAVFCVYGKKLSVFDLFGREAFLNSIVCTSDIREVLQRAVALRPEERFDSMASFRAALAAARGDDVVEGAGEETVLPWPIQIELAAPVTADQGRDHRRDSQSRTVHGVEMVLVPGGRFVMGSPEEEEGRDDDESPQHEVALASFWLARTPVTNAQYREYIKANPGVVKPRFWADHQFAQPENPVVGVSWVEAKAYCQWAGLLLPTEAQWEYACRAGTTSRFSSGDGEEHLKKVGWYRGNSGGQMHAVGELEPNGWGLYDMHGNVYEWCEDVFAGYGRELRHEPDGVADRIVRGGTFVYEARFARSAYRDWVEPFVRWGSLGFRPAQGHVE